MTLMVDRPLRTLLELTAEIVASHVGNNAVSLKDLPSLISGIHDTLALLEQGQVGVVPGKPEPAVPIKRSITPEYLICLEDGKKFKMLKGHLRSFNLTPGQYREKWGLPDDYPMVAPNYAKRRAELSTTAWQHPRKHQPKKDIADTALPRAARRRQAPKRA